MRRAIWLLPLVLVFVSGCALLQGLMGKFREPTLTFKSVSVSDASLSGATINLTYTLRNPNPVGLTLSTVDYAFFVEGKQVVAGRPPRGVTIPSSGGTDLVLPASVKFADLAPVVQTFLTKDTATFKATGTIGIDTPLGTLKLPLKKEGTFEVPKIPTVTLGTPRIASLSATTATVEFPLTVTNRNSFPLPISGLTGALAISGARVGTLGTPDLGALAAKSPKEVTVPLTINLLQAASAANALRSGRGNVSLSGEIRSGSVALPISLNQAVNFVR